MTLLDGFKGNTYRIQSIDLEEQVKRRLEMLGMTHGTEILLLNQKSNGSTIIKVRGTRFAIGKHIVSGITIEEEAK